MKCNHAATQTLPELWFRCKPIGVQPGYNDDGELDPAEDLALANCPACHSTLSLPVAVERRWSSERDEKRVAMMPLDYTTGSAL